MRVLVRFPTISPSRYLNLGQELESKLGIEDPIPTLDDPIPVLDDPIPVLDDPIPTLDDPIPTLDDPIPTLDDPTPTLDDPTPTLDDPMPMPEALSSKSSNFFKEDLRLFINFLIILQNMILSTLPSIFLLVILTRFIGRVFIL